MMERVRQARGQGFAFAENIPIVGGATACLLLPVTAQGRPVAFGVGGTIERIRPQKDALIAMMRRLAAQLGG